MNDDLDLDARMSLLRQKNELIDRSLTAFLAYSKKIDEIYISISILREKDEMDYPALKVLQDTQSRLSAESSKETYLVAELSHEYDIEEKEFYFYLAQRGSISPKRKPTENGSVEIF